ncbi:hypothetical protein [Mesorhizobium marinum]|uniref:hypothetical protein n=1 Tax=Mesorhizobium marinum TaxID=3228790 RepID=UPI00346739C8
MAKLKIFKDNNTALEIPSADGYINVTKNLILMATNYDYFKAENHKAERPSLLTTHAGYDEGNTKLKIYHELEAGGSAEIIDDNCMIDVTEDKKKPNGNDKSKFHIAFPPDRPVSVGYLKPYVQVLGSILFDPNVPDGDERLERACQFLFGMMLLTRCR